MINYKIQKTTIDKIKTLHESIVERLKTSLDDAIEIGGLLIEQKEKLDHGQWMPWVATNLPFKDRTARNYMKIYRERDRLKTASVADLNGAYRLLNASKKSDGIIYNFTPEQGSVMNSICELIGLSWHRFREYFKLTAVLKDIFLDSINRKIMDRDFKTVNEILDVIETQFEKVVPVIREENEAVKLYLNEQNSTHLMDTFNEVKEMRETTGLKSMNIVRQYFDQLQVA